MTTHPESDPRLSPEQTALVAEAHAFAREVLRPAASRLDKLDPERVIAPGSDLWRTLGAAYRAGWHSLLVPRNLGGRGLAGLDLALVLEELGWGSADFAISLAVTGFPFYLAAGLGGPELAETFAKTFAADRDARWVGCWALTEPDHGSDHFFMHGPSFRDPAVRGGVTARREGDGWVIDGEKARWISNGTIATHAALYLATAPERGLAGGGIALVPLDLPGVSRGPPLDKLGQRGLNQGGIAFQGVCIPGSYLLAGADAYPALLDRTLALTNAAMGAIFTGLARAAYEEALDYTRRRIQGGRPLCEHQLVQRRLFDMFVAVETSRAIARNAFAFNADREIPATELATAAKVHCTEAAFAVCHSAVQLFGGNGLAREHLVEKLFRDARASLIEDGSNDVLALSAARQILGRLEQGEEHRRTSP